MGVISFRKECESMLMIDGRNFVAVRSVYAVLGIIPD
jgi:hypothetical protein